METLTILDSEDVLARESVVMIEYRAARPAEVRRIDAHDAERVVPAYVLLTRDEWHRAAAPFTSNRLARQRVTDPLDHLAPPGSMVWAQLATRSGQVIVGGRDQAGFPAFPVSSPDGDIRFESAVPLSSPGARRRDGAFDLPWHRLVTEPTASCRPILSSEGSITCAAPGCRDCLHAINLNGWHSVIACMCRESNGEDGALH